MNLGQLMDTLRSAYEQLEHPQISGLKTIHQKNPVDSALQAEFDAVLSRIEKEGQIFRTQHAKPKPDQRHKAA